MPEEWREWIPGVRLLALHRINDRRGWFMKVAMAPQLSPAGLAFGEMYLTAAAPGKMRGAHYHCKTWEWFLVIKGSARFLAKPEASPEWSSLDLSEDVPKLIEVPPFVAHVFVGTGSMEMVLLAYSNRPFDPNDADTYPKEP